MNKLFTKILLVLSASILLSSCGLNKDKIAQETARTLLRETVSEECVKLVNKNKVVSVLLTNKKEEVDNVCACVSDDVFNHVTADEMLTVATNKEERKKIAIVAGSKSVLTCAKKLNYIK